MIDRVDDTAQRVLELNPDPVPRTRLLREVLGRRTRTSAVDASRHVRALKRMQRADGGFGWLHRADLACTEGAVRRINALGLPPRHPLCAATARHLTGLLDGSIAALDRPERNDRWPTGFELFTASTLTRLNPTHRATLPVKRKWRRILIETFADGRYHAAREIDVHARTTGASIAGTYLRLDNKYAVQLLATTNLDSDLRRAYFDWLWSRDHLRYLLTPPAISIGAVPGHRRGSWLTTHSLLSAFPEWSGRFRRHTAGLWGCRESKGLWDFGPRHSNDLEFPMSESWRPRTARSIDWSVRCLLLLARMDPP